MKRISLLFCLIAATGTIATVSVFPVSAMKPVVTPDLPLTPPAADARTASSFARSVAADSAGQVHVVYENTQNGRTYIHYRRSPDRGVSWGPEQRLSIDGGISPSVAVAGMRVYVAWETVTPNPSGVQLAHSSNSGTTWSSPIRIAEGRQPCIAVSGATLHLVGAMAGDSEMRVFYRRSVDEGRSWEPEQVLSGSGKAAGTPSIAVAGTLIVMAYVDTPDGNEEEYVRISTDTGQTWGKEIRLTKNRLSSGPPSVAVAGQTVHIAWADQKANGDDLSDAERQLDEIMHLIGLSFTSESIRKTQAGVFDTEALQARIEHKRQQVQAAASIWGARGGDPLQIGAMLREVDRIVKTATNEWDIYYRRSEDAGKTWGNEMRVTDTPGASRQASIGASGDEVRLVWSDDRDGAPALYHTTSVDEGRT